MASTRSEDGTGGSAARRRKGPGGRKPAGFTGNLNDRVGGGKRPKLGVAKSGKGKR